MAAGRAGSIAERGAVCATHHELCDASCADRSPPVEAQNLAPQCGCLALARLARRARTGRGVRGRSADFSAWHTVSFRCSEAAMVYRRGDERDVLRVRTLSGCGGSVRLRRGQATLDGNGVRIDFFCCTFPLTAGCEHLREFA